ncbi:alpha/beta hydrolase, partial [Mesorhizobium sp. M4B.F.Ca.ET.013.02.1.1]
MPEYTDDGGVFYDLSFLHRFIKPSGASGECLFLLHGSGVDETTLVPFARQIAPRAALVAARGRIP